MTKKSARADAPDAYPANDEESSAEQAEHLDMQAPPTEADMMWVFHAFGMEDLEKENAPSPGAWALYIAAKGDNQLRNKIYGNILPKPSKTDADDSGPEDMLELTQLQNTIASEWGDVAGILDALSKKPELIEPVMAVIQEHA